MPSFSYRLPVIPSVPNGIYGWRNYTNRPQYFGYQYYLPDYAFQRNYSVPFATYPGDYYVPNYYYPRPYQTVNRYAQTQNVACYANEDKSNYCPVNTQHVTNEQGQHYCHYPPNGVNISAPQSLDQCQNPSNWPAAIAYDQLEN